MAGSSRGFSHFCHKSDFLPSPNAPRRGHHSNLSLLHVIKGQANMKIKYLLAASAVSLTAATAVVPTVASAQQITSGVEGRVTDEEGNALPGATVTITDTRTGSTRTLSTGGNGGFNATGLVAGGPYNITATAEGFEGQTLEGQSLSASGSLRLTFSLTPSASGEVIVVTGARVQASQLAVGPGQAFDLEALEGFPSITRNVVDIIRTKFMSIIMRMRWCK